MFYVYVIKNQNDKIYIGQTGDLEKRINQHKETIKRKKELKTSRGRSFIRSNYRARSSTAEQ